MKPVLLSKIAHVQFLQYNLAIVLDTVHGLLVPSHRGQHGELFV